MKEKNKIIKSFCIVGLKDSLIKKYDDDNEKVRFIQNIDILIKNLPYSYKPSNENENWILLIKEKNVWLRIKYNYEYANPITDFKFVECAYESPDYILLEKKYIDEQYRPVMIVRYKENKDTKETRNELYSIMEECKYNVPFSEVYVKIPSYLNINKILNLKQVSKCHVLLISRKYSLLPLYEIIVQRKDQKFNFQIKRNKSPYLFKYIPEILDQYPPNEESNSSVSMFCFPNGLEIKEIFEMPRWFTFVLTDEFGERTYGSTLIFWEDIDNNFKENFIPFYDEIDTKTKKYKYHFVPKAICILSRFPFYYNNLLFLKQLYKIQTANKSLLPLERVICTFVDSLYIQSNNEISQFILGREKLNYYRISNYGELWDTNNNCLDVLFHVLSFDQIITAWKGLLLEKKLFLICSSKATLSYVSHALITLLFPFKWIHVYVPILPEKLKLFVDSPVPLIIGISFPIELDDFPSDALILNINKNQFQSHFSQIPKFRGKLNAFIESKFKDIKKSNIYNPKISEKWMDFQDEVYPMFELENKNEINIPEIRDSFYNIFIHIFKNYKKYIDWEEIQNYMNNNNNQNDDDISQKIFKKNIFLKDHSCNDENDFIVLFSETSLFNQFIETFIKRKPESAMVYFLESIKNRKNDKKGYLPEIIPEKIRILPEIDIRDLNKKIFSNKVFPVKLDKSLYIKCSRPEKIFKSLFIKYEDEWCYEISKLKKKESIKYSLYIIYEIWFHFFSFVIHFYGDKESLIMMDFALFLLEDLNNNKKIKPTRTLFSKIFKSCGRDKLSDYINKLLLLVHKTYKNSKYSNLFHNSYLSGLYALTENIGVENSNISLPSNNSYLNITLIRKNILSEISCDNYNTKKIIDNILFLNYKICPNCLKSKSKLFKINIEYIFGGFDMEDNNLYIICPKCLVKIEPILYYFKNSQSNLKPNKFKLINPCQLLKNIDNLINKEREILFYKKMNDLMLINIYLSIIFYFQLFDLPLFVLYTPNNNDNNFINEIEEEIQYNKLRKISKKEKRKNGKSISPDRISHSPDRSPDNKSRASTDLSDPSSKSTLSNISVLENELLKNIKNILDDKEILSNEKINSNEKNDFASRLKYIKIDLSKLMQYFDNNSKELIDIFLSKNAEQKEDNNDTKMKNENIILKKYIKTVSNKNIEINKDIELNIDKIYQNTSNDNNQNIKKRNIQTNLNVINNISNNLQKKLKNENENFKKDEEEKEHDKEKINSSFSGIIEILKDNEQKNKDISNKNFNKEIINIEKEIISSKEEKNELNNEMKHKNNIQISEDLKKNNPTLENNKNNMKKINEFEYKDNILIDNDNDNIINNLSNKEIDFDKNNNSKIVEKENKDETNNNDNKVVKKHKKFKIYSEGDD